MSAEVPAFICSHVAEKRSCVLVVSRADGDWQFLCGGTHEEAEAPRVVGLNHLVDDDPSLRAILDLPADWEAERASRGTPWRRQAIGEGEGHERSPRGWL